MADDNPPLRCYLICSTARSGSSLLSEMLADTGLAGYPEEAVTKAWRREHGWCSRESVFENLSERATPNGVFGIKMMWSQFDETRRCFEDQAEFAGLTVDRLFERLLPNLKYIWIRRRDREAQAVSLAIAQQTGLWTSRHPTKDHSEPVFNFYQIHDSYLLTLFHEEKWQEYFDTYDIHPLQIFFEDYVDNFRSTIETILEYLDIAQAGEVKIGEPPLRRLGAERNKQWVSQYRSLRGSDEYRSYNSVFQCLRLLAEDRSEEAIALLDEVPQEAPLYYLTRVFCGAIKMGKGDYPGSERELNAAIALNPGEAMAYAHRARLRGLQGRVSESLDDLAVAEVRVRETDTEDDADLLIRDVRLQLQRLANGS